MTTRALFYITTVLCCFTSSNAQEFEEAKGKKGLPDSVVWDLSDAKEDLQLKAHTYTIPGNWNIGEKPDTLTSVTIALVKAHYLNLEKEFDVSKLSKQLENTNFAICPAWVCVQIFLENAYTGKAVWFPLVETQGAVRIGCNGSHADIGGSKCTRTDLFSDDPRKIMGGDIIVLMRKN